MKSIDVEYLQSWANANGLALRTLSSPPLWLGYAEPVALGKLAVVYEDLPPGKLVLLANRLVLLLSDNEMQNGSSKLDETYVFWIRTIVGDDITESIGDETIGKLLIGYDCERDVHMGTKGLLFEADDMEAAKVFVLMTMLFGWDAYLIPLSGRFICNISHDGVVEIHVRSEEIRDLAKERLSFWGIVTPRPNLA